MRTIMHHAAHSSPVHVGTLFIIPPDFGRIPVDIQFAPFIIYQRPTRLIRAKSFYSNYRNPVGHKTSNTAIMVINDREQIEEA